MKPLHLVERRKRGVLRVEVLAKKHESEPPSKEQHHDHWGYPYILAGPGLVPCSLIKPYTASISSPAPGSNINADNNIGGFATGCGSLSKCGTATALGFSGALDSASILTDMYNPDDSGGGDGGVS